MPRIIRKELQPSPMHAAPPSVNSAQSAGFTTYEWVASQFKTETQAKEIENSCQAEPTERRRWRRKVDDGYNSEDEYCRPKISEVDEKSLQVVLYRKYSHSVVCELSYSCKLPQGKTRV
jgi:hypothetical protein